jgi:type IV secretory pathway VirB10-like protein
MATDEREERPDCGAVPRTLLPPGYRSVSPLVGVAAIGIVLAVIVSVLGSILFHPHAVLAAPPPLKLQPTSNNGAPILPDPTDPPFHTTPRTHPVVRFVPPASPVRVASASTTSVPTESLGPRVTSPAQPIVDEDARRLTDARYASARMQLDTQDNASQEHSVLSPAIEILHGNEIVTSSVMRNVAESGTPHGTFLEARNGNPGYEEETGPYELVTGTIIPARLITAIDSTVPGGIVKAEIIESIFDSKTHSVVVLPQGTIAIGYTDQALTGEARLVAAWTEFYLPNGRKFFASSNEGAGEKGEAGMPVTVDTHAGRAFGNTIVGAVLQAGVNLTSRATTIDISTAGNSVQTQRLAPTLHAYPGQLFNIMLNHDLPLDQYVENEQ